MLTKKQYELLLFINTKIKKTGVSPSFDEMKDALCLKSKSGIHRLVTALEERGFIRRLPHRARALEVLKLPEHALNHGSAAAPAPRFKPSVIEGDKKLDDGNPDAPLGVIERNNHNLIELPVYGRIAAGFPQEAVSQDADRISVPASMIRGAGEHFVLEVRGESMINAGILDGDIAIIHRTSQAVTGNIIVAYIPEQQEATLKRLRRRNGAVALEPANPDFPVKVFQPDKVNIQGRLVGILRTY